MADQLTPEAQALAKQPKAFTLPPAPELKAIGGQIGGVPGAPEIPAKRPEFKTSAEAAAEQERQLARLSQVEAPIMAAEQAGREYEATARAEVARQSREQAQNIEANLDYIREQFPYPQFKPTQENIQSLSTLFSLLGVVGVAMGGTGKMSAMNSLNAMSGMMKGWQQGRKDLWEREKAEFDKGMAKTKAVLEDAYKDADRAYKALAYNREEASALAAQSVAKLGGQVGKQILEKQGIERYVAYLDGVRKDLKEAERLAAQEKKEQKRLDAQIARDAARAAHENRMANIQEARLRLAEDKAAKGEGGKPLKEKEVQQIEGLSSLSQELRKLEKEFKPEYASLGVLGFGSDLAMEAKRRLGTEEGAKAVQWWSKYERLQAPNRHSLFGATLTGNELKNYQSFTAKKSDDPTIVKNMLLDQADYSDATAHEKALAFERAGYKVPDIRPKGFLETYSGAPPVQKATEAEIKAYADKYFGGDTTKASDDLKRKGFL